MGNRIKIGILGFGNIGKGVVEAIKQNDDMELVSVFTRRDAKELSLDNQAIPFAHVSEVRDYADKVDVMILCGGSATDLPVDGPNFSKWFNTVDSFDTHAKIPNYFEAVNEVAKEHRKTSIISIGWDPGLFSMNRLLMESILPKGETYTFWGKGVSQGHSDAIRRIEGVHMAIQYTIPIEESVARVREGDNPTLNTAEKHRRVCYVVLKPGYNQESVEETIKTMPNYFDEYETTVDFITEEEFVVGHSKMPHGGFVIRSGKTGMENKQLMEYSLRLDSNPEFTSSVLVAYARAAYRMYNENNYGAKTIFDVPISYVSTDSAEELRRKLL